MKGEDGRSLNAGPVRIKFADGELRYLRVNGREVLRRVYFAVRDAHWDTVPPNFEVSDVVSGAEEFTVEFRARCVNEIADVAWNGRIEGRTDGSITFTAEWQPGADFEYPRIGICVLYGAEALAGRDYEVVHADGKRDHQSFPRFISPYQFAKDFTSLQVTTREQVGLTVAVPGARMDMEDQRNYGDSSYKAFVEGAALRHQRLEIAVDTSATQVLKEPPPTPPIVIGGPTGVRLPRLTRTARTSTEHEYTHYNRNRTDYADAARIEIPFNPAVHLDDDDTLMENIPAILDQAATIRSFAPDAALHAGPVLFDPPYPRSRRDPRNGTAFATAWLGRFVKFAAHAGIVEAAIALADGPWTALHEELSSLAGRRLLEAGADPHAGVDVLAVDGHGAWVINNRAATRQVTVRQRHGEQELVLAPYEVVPLSSTGG